MEDPRKYKTVKKTWLNPRQKGMKDPRGSITQAPSKIEQAKRNVVNFFKNPKRGRFIKDVATIAINIAGPGKVTKLGKAAKKFKQFSKKFNVK